MEWEGYSLELFPFAKIWVADDWYARPVSERHFNCLSVWGRDELDVCMKLIKAEEQNNDS